MSASASGTDPRGRLRTVSRALQDLHRSLLEYQRRDYEKSFGRIGSDFYVLQLAAEDPQFAWLRALTAEMMRIDVLLSGGGLEDDDVLLAGSRLRHLLSPNANGSGFQARYDEAMQANPSIIMAHAAVMRSLPPAGRVIVFRSEPPSEMETGDMPGIERRMHRPGEIVPGHGDHGYRALAAVVETIVPPGTTTPMRTLANEEVICWVPDGVVILEDADRAPWPVDPGHIAVLNAGTGLDYALQTADDAPTVRVIQLHIRPYALKLEPALQHGPVAQAPSGEWRLLVAPEEDDAPFTVRNNVTVSDITLAPGQETRLPCRDGWDTWFFVFDGEVTVEGTTFAASQSGLVVQPGSVTVRAMEPSRMIAVCIDPAAKITRAGSIGR